MDSQSQPSSGSVPLIPLRSGLAVRDWTVMQAIAVTAGVMLASYAFAFLLQAIYGVWHGSLEGDETIGVPGPESALALMSVQIASQLLQLLLLGILASAFVGNIKTAFNLVPVSLSAGRWIGLVALLFAIKAAAAIASRGFGPSDPKTELGPVLELARSPDAWVVFLAAVVLAALVEELIFRGVLSRTLEKTRLGFWAGAAIASAAFAVLHMQYGIAGQAIIFAVGLTLAWIRSSTGSLWPSIICHAVNNGVALLAMRAMS